MQYSQYLQSGHWQEIRAQKLKQRPFCQICKSTDGLNVHHKRYADKHGASILFKERLIDLITLCGSCHKLCHLYLHGREKLNKKFLRVQTLMRHGVLKNKAFWIVGMGLWEVFYGKAKKFKKENEFVYINKKVQILQQKQTNIFFKETL